MGIYNKEFGRFSPYLLNKKLKPSKKIDGKYVYFYPNDKKKHGYWDYNRNVDVHTPLLVDNAYNYFLDNLRSNLSRKK